MTTDPTIAADPRQKIDAYLTVSGVAAQTPGRPVDRRRVRSALLSHPAPGRSVDRPLALTPLPSRSSRSRS